MNGVIMVIPFKKIEGFVLVLIVLVSSYLMVVQLVNAFKPEGMLKSFDVVSLRKHSSGNRFAVNDVFVVKAECGRVNAYRVEFYSKDRLVFEKDGGVCGSAFEARVPVVPPNFSAGNVYVAFLYVYALNDPIPGAFFSDSASCVVEVEGTGTRMQLSGGYDSSFGSLCLRANLTDADGFPVANEGVEFSMQFSHEHRATDGWFPIGSAVTNESGIAKMCTALSIPYENYTIRAEHVGNANYGESEAAFDVEVSNSSRFDGFGFFAHSENVVPEGASGVRVVSMTMSYDGDPYAVLPTRVRVMVEFNCSVSDQRFIVVIFKLENLSDGFSLDVCPLEPMGTVPPYLYNASLVWTPDERIPNVIGPHKLWAGVYVGNDFEELFAAEKNGTGITFRMDADIEVHLCPSNTTVLVPDAMYGDCLNTTYAVSRPRFYEENEVGGFVSYSLASKFLHYNMSYAVDEAAAGLCTELLVNGAHEAWGLTDDKGLGMFSPRISFPGSHSSADLAVRVNSSSFLYEGREVTSHLNLTKIDVKNTVDGANNSFRLDSSLGCGYGYHSAPIYVGVDKSVDVDASLFGLPFSYTPVSVLIGKIQARYCSDSSGWLSRAGSSDFLRVLCLYNISASYGDPTADVNRDGKVDLKDVYTTAKAFGAVACDRKWNWVADVNCDWKIDLKDYFRVCKGYGKTVIKYVDLVDFGSLKLALYDENGCVGEYNADQWGCFSPIETRVTSLKLILNGQVVGGIVEFFNNALHRSVFTNNVGKAGLSWIPQETGVVGHNCLGGKPPYVMEVWMPSRFQALTTRWDDAKPVSAALNVVRLLDVLKRPVNLTVDMPSEFHVKAVEAEADASVYSNYPTEPFGDYGDLEVGGGEPYPFEAISYVRFSLSSIPANAYVVSARLNLFSLTPWGGNSGYEYLDYEVFRVTSSWDESSVTWVHQPTCEAVPSLSFRCDELVWYRSEWLFLNLTSDVRMWLGGSDNFGWVLKRKLPNDNMLWLNSSESNALHPGLEVSYVLPSPMIVANAYDGAAQKSLSAWPLNVSVNGAPVDCGVTNSSGVAVVSSWQPASNVVYNVTVSYSGNETYSAGRTSSLLDFRYPTNVTSSKKSPFTVPVGGRASVGLSVASSALFGLCDVHLGISLNGTSVDGRSHLFDHTDVVTWESVFRYEWSVPWDGLYCIKAEFNGTSSYKPSETFLVANATVTPLAILFSVSPCEFEAGTNIVLNATVMDVTTNEKICNDYTVTVEFFKVSQTGTNSSLGTVPTFNGVATKNFAYPTDDRAYAFLAKIVSVGVKIPQGVCSSPVQLTISKPTKLMLNATRLEGSVHVIWGWLKYYASGLPNRTVRIKINETEYTNTTLPNGYFMLKRDLKSEDHKRTVYKVSATFEGNEPKNATAWAYTVDGTRYAACTTICFGYKPSNNTSVLDVTPLGTEVFTSVEEMQKIAEQRGWLRVRHEFRWRWPFYRIHYIIDLRDTVIDVGFSPIGETVESLFGIAGRLVGSVVELPGGETLAFQGLGLFREVVAECITQFMWEAVSLMAEYASAKAGYWTDQPWIALVALGFEGGEELVSLRWYWDNPNEMLTFGVVNIILGLITVKVDLAVAFLQGLFNVVGAPAMSALYLLTNKAIIAAGLAQETKRDLINVIEIAMTFAFATAALARCKGMWLG
jgi:hypothetical protein